MAYLELNDVSKSFNGTAAVQDLSLSLERGQCLALLGPSGCGKSTTLSMIAGFLNPDRGLIQLEGKVLNNLPPERRNFGMAFQSYALFPHLSVFDNVGYGLRCRRISGSQYTHRIEKALALVRLTGFESRWPRQLSGGQQQRVALARAIVIEPDLLLLDEPLSNLDARLRADMQIELSDIVRRAGVTTIFVTHDQEEAMVIADKIAVMRSGSIQQVGTAREVYHQPANDFVAGFVGSFNSFTGEIIQTEEHDRLGVRTANGLTIVAVSQRSDPPIGSSVVVAVRPERMRLLSGTEAADNCIVGVVDKVHFVGNSLIYFVCYGTEQITVTVPNDCRDRWPARGDSVRLGWNRGDCVVFPLAD